MSPVLVLMFYININILASEAQANSTRINEIKRYVIQPKTCIHMRNTKGLNKLISSKNNRTHGE